MDSRSRLLAVLKQSNPQTALLTVDDLVWGVPEVNSTLGRNTKLTLTAKPGSGYSGTAVLYYNRHVLNAVFGQHVSITANQGQSWADVVDMLNQRSALYKVPLEQLVTLDPASWVLNQYNPITVAAAPAALEWIGDFTGSLWLKLPQETGPDTALGAVLAVQTRVEALEVQVLTLNAITQGGIVHSVAGFSGAITREQLGLDRLDAMWDTHSPNAIIRQNDSTDDLVFGQPVYSLGSTSVALADARDTAKKMVFGLVAQDLIVSTGGSGKVQTSGVLTGTVSQWERATGMVGGLVTNRAYYLDTVQGRLTPFAPSEHGQFLVALGLAISPTELSIQIESPLTL